MYLYRICFCFCAVTLLACVGCSRGPDRPEFDAGKCAAAALEAYDTDGDGSLSHNEYSVSPGLLAAAERIDTDQNGVISSSEIQDRINYYRNATTAVVSGGVRVIYKRRGLADATVTFDPEPFLGEEFQPCSGITDEFGETFVSREGAEFPGIYLGMYRVRISKLQKDNESVPSEYNTETTLGFEAANDLPDVSDVLTFHLK